MKKPSEGAFYFLLDFFSKVRQTTVAEMPFLKMYPFSRSSFSCFSGFLCDICIVIVRSSSLLLQVPREGCHHKSMPI